MKKSKLKCAYTTRQVVFEKNVLTEQQELELSPGVPLVTPQLSLDFLVDALLFLGLLGQAARHCNGSSTLRPGPPRRRRTVGCCGAPVITCCAVLLRLFQQPPPPPPPTRPAAADASCHSTVTTAPCLAKKRTVCCVSSTSTTALTAVVRHPRIAVTTTTTTTTGDTPSSLYTPPVLVVLMGGLMGTVPSVRGRRRMVDNGATVHHYDGEPHNPGDAHENDDVGTQRRMDGRNMHHTRNTTHTHTLATAHTHTRGTRAKNHTRTHTTTLTRGSEKMNLKPRFSVAFCEQLFYIARNVRTRELTDLYVCT